MSNEPPQGNAYNKDVPFGQSNKKEDQNDFDVDTDEYREHIAEKLRDAGLDIEHFIDVENGSKRSVVGHSSRDNQLGPDSIEGNYGIYAGRGLVDIDIDDYDDDFNTDAVDALPETFTVDSAHGGEHRYYAVTSSEDEIHERLHEDAGVRNPKMDWGEIRVNNQYTVGPGSQLDGCNRDECDECDDPSGGFYSILNDASLARIDYEDLLEVVLSAEKYPKETESFGFEGGEADTVDNATIQQRLERCFENAPDGDRIQTVYEGRYGQAGFDDRSDAEKWFSCRIDSWVAFGSRRVISNVMDNGNLNKWSERTDQSYREYILSSAGSQDWYADTEMDDDDDDTEADADVEDDEAGHGHWLTENIFEMFIEKAEDAQSRYQNELDAVDENQLGENETAHGRVPDTVTKQKGESESRVKRAVVDATESVFDAVVDDVADIFGADPEAVESYRHLSLYIQENGNFINHDGSLHYVKHAYIITEEQDDYLKEQLEAEVANFEINVRKYLTPEHGDTMIDTEIVPNDPFDDAKDLTLTPNDLVEYRDAKKVLTGGNRTARFYPRAIDSRWESNEEFIGDLKEWVGAQHDVPSQKGTQRISFSDSYDCLATPGGALTANGFVPSEEANLVYHNPNGDSDADIGERWELDELDFNRGTVAKILKNLVDVRPAERLAPILGWWYAAPFKQIMREEGVLSDWMLLKVFGATGAGKTHLNELLWESFGMEGNAMSADQTPFPHMRNLSSTSTVPIVLDEYNTTEITSYRLNGLHQVLKRSTKGGIEYKGNKDKSQEKYFIDAPVVVSGETEFDVPALKRRALPMTLLKPTTKDPKHEVPYKKLAGGTIENVDLSDVGLETHPSGMPLGEHASAYYTYLMRWLDEHDVGAELEEWHREAMGTVDNVLEKHDIKQLPDELDYQKLRIVVFGLRFMQAFAESVGVEEALFTDAEVEDAILCVCDELIEEGVSRSNEDRFIELFGMAVRAEYLEEGEHYAFTHLDSESRESELRVHLRDTIAQISSYLRDHNMDDSELYNESEYKKWFSNAAEYNDDPYVAEMGVQEHQLGNRRCVSFLLNKLLQFDITYEDLGLYVENEIDEEDDDEDYDADGGIDDSGEDGGDDSGANRLQRDRSECVTEYSELEDDDHVTIEGTVTDSEHGGDSMEYKVEVTSPETSENDVLSQAWVCGWKSVSPPEKPARGERIAVSAVRFEPGDKWGDQLHMTDESSIDVLSESDWTPQEDDGVLGKPKTADEIDTGSDNISLRPSEEMQNRVKIALRPHTDEPVSANILAGEVTEPNGDVEMALDMLCDDGVAERCDDRTYRFVGGDED